MSLKKRNRGYILIPEGLQKLQRRLREWESARNTGYRYSQEKLAEMTGLHSDTIRKVLGATEGSDLSSIERMFQSFDLALAEQDYVQVGQTPDRSFVGREEAIVALNKIAQDAKIIVIHGRGGVGKTTLARKYFKQGTFALCLEKWMATETKNIISVESIVEEWLRRYFHEEPGCEFGITLSRLREKLRKHPQHIGILIDNLEPALNGDGSFIADHRRYVELLTVLSDPDVNALTLVTSRERLLENITVSHYHLDGLSLEAWHQFFESKGIQSSPAILAMHQFYDGNAKAMDILSASVCLEFEGDAEIYWQTNQNYLPPELEGLVRKQFQRLEQVNSSEYNLLCRSGCYRYQDVPSVPIAGLDCLLWDVAEDERYSVIQSLKNRSLLTFHKGQFWIHPVIRKESIRRLKTTRDWHEANLRAASFLGQSIQLIQKTPEALTALEPYHHYVQIGDFPRAADVLMGKRLNVWGTNESLMRSFYKRGFLQQMVNSISNVLDNLTIEEDATPLEQLNYAYRKAKLRHTLGAIAWLSGHIPEAIQHCEEAKKTAASALLVGESDSYLRDVRLNLKIVEINARLTIGICKIGFWDLETALADFLEIVELSRAVNYEKFAPSALFYVAFLQSYLGQTQSALEIANRLYDDLPEKSLPFWVTEYRLSYLGQTYMKLGELERAVKIFDRVLECIQASPYTQAAIKAQNGRAELHRREGNFPAAVVCHAEAIRVATEMGAQYDLAEAYYQQGLTYREANQLDEGNASFERAKQIFEQIHAPKQVTKVQTALESDAMPSQLLQETETFSFEPLCESRNTLKIEWKIILDAPFEETSSEQIEVIIEYLRHTSKDYSIRLKQTNSGSIVITLEGSEEGFKIIQALYKEGKLTETIGLPVKFVGCELPQPNTKNSNTQPNVDIFFSYSHRDELLRSQLEKHLSAIHNGKIKGWHDRQIGPGSEWQGKIDHHLEISHIILLLVSSDFIASRYCYDIELVRAMKRHDAGDARVIPIILRPVFWQDTPFGRLQALPKGCVPVTSWENQDEAFLDISIGIRSVVDEIFLKCKTS
ncbi:MAG: tetratricopeptide repeat protein [Timaviella obliquedivisa GSE-PSE-MK23-08B]|jgi:tetratricopeptide (TPR) repeat protein|nr:tetratricopeptide repeat protein [Timaviella obliquedivisa GSE-PSE-MK23-08B]